MSTTVYPVFHMNMYSVGKMNVLLYNFALQSSNHLDIHWSSGVFAKACMSEVLRGGSVPGSSLVGDLVLVHRTASLPRRNSRSTVKRCEIVLEVLVLLFLPSDDSLSLLQILAFIARCVCLCVCRRKYVDKQQLHQ
ncbi:hypothetical protein D917_06499 [Trichinella nativa]|uniref:Uncharacterized protein n=1 Tax=Trichinella nativa TaxID=6335 RepID=A0A1Y3ETA3_9BILA|nr:hypothetical protein D917_06499 [Trichinella nativa]